METGLREYERDLGLLVRAGDGALMPPDEVELVRLAQQHLVDERPLGNGEKSPDPTSARLTYLRWKPGLSTTAAYVVRCSDQTTAIVVAKRYADGKAAEFEGRSERRAAEVAESGWKPRAILGERGLTLRVFPSDRELPGHQALLDPRRLSRLVHAANLVPPRSIRRRRTRVTLLRYKPERRSVWRVDLRLRDVEPTARVYAARILPPAVAERVRTMRAAGGPVDGSRIGPRLLASDPKSGLLLEEWLDVETLGDAGLERTSEVAGILARLHGANPPPPASIPAPVERAALRGLFSVDERLWSLAERIPTPECVHDAWIHGDLHPDQLAKSRQGGHWWLLDLDNVGPGDRSRELAGWIVDSLCTLPRRSMSSTVHELIDAYARAGGVVPAGDVLASHVADLLVHSAAGCLRRLEVDASQKAEERLSAAAAVNEGAFA